MSIPRVLIIAGSDSGGGAGIQADIKTVTMLGGHAITAITAITAQNTVGVNAVLTVPTDMVLAQIDAVVDDIGVDAVKIGMLGSPETARAVAGRLDGAGVPIVFDPVMVATSGAALADDATIAAFGRLMDVSTLVTPNLPELATLVPSAGSGADDPIQAALQLVSRHRCAVLVKGGHDEGDALADALVEDDNITSWQGQRIDTRDTHGTGCTMASAIAVLLAQGRTLPQAVDGAREFVRLALRGAPGLGQGHGPVGQGSVRLDLGGAMRLNQVAVGLDDYEASRDFYRELGLTLIVDSAPDYARFECGGGATFSIHRQETNPGSLSPLAPLDTLGTESPSPGGRGDSTTVYFECDDLDAEVDRLSRLGMRFEHGPANQSWLWREARLLDPFGNTICLYKAGEARRYPPWRV